jgi:DNA-binding protein
VRRENVPHPVHREDYLVVVSHKKGFFDNLEINELPIKSNGLKMRRDVAGNVSTSIITLQIFLFLLE